MRRTLILLALVLVGVWLSAPSRARNLGSPSPHGSGRSALADLNGDGFDDLVVGVPGEEVNGQAGAGALSVLYGGPAGLSSTDNQFWTQDSPGIIGTAQAGDNWGATVVTGDFDGDGYGDVAAGLPNQDVEDQVDAGAVIVLYGSPVGLTQQDNDGWTQDNPTIGGQSEAGDHFGSSLAAGDFDGDGYDDLAMGSYGESVDPINGAGAVNVLYGGPSGLGRTGNQFWAQDVPGVLDQGETDDYFGWSLGAGDFNADGIDDLAIGTMLEDVNGAVDAGGVNVLYGSFRGLSTAGNQFWTQDSPGVLDTSEIGDRLGRSLTPGDFDGDGIDDLAIGASGEAIGARGAAGAVNVLYGSAGGLSSTGNQFWSQDSAGILDQAETGDNFGYSVSAGDFDGDGFDDLAVGTVFEDVGVIADAGSANVLYGTAAGLSSTGNQLWSQNSSGIGGQSETADFFGIAVAGADFDGDGRDDLAIGAYGEGYPGLTSAGAVTAINGSGSGLSSAGSQFWFQDSPGILDQAETGDNFGLAVGRGCAARPLLGAPHADLVEVAEQVGRIIVHAIGAGALQLLLTIPARQHADPQRPGPPGREQVPHAVADHHRLGDTDAETIGRGQEQVRVWLGVDDLVSGDHRHVSGEVEELEGRARALQVAAGGDGPRHPRLREVCEELAAARERPHLPDPLAVRGTVEPAKARRLLRRQHAPGFAHERAREQAPAHAHLAMDPPHGDVDPHLVQRVPPGQDVLVDAVDQGAVQVEQERRPPLHG